MMKKFLKVLTPILSAIIGILATNEFNIFEFMTFVPKDYTYEICISTYFVIADVIIDVLTNDVFSFIKLQFISEIEVIISKQGTRNNVDADSILEFNDDDLTEASIIVRIKGKKKHFENTNLIINKPSFAEIQSASSRSEVTVDNDKCSIKLADIFGANSSIDSTQTFKIAMIQDPVDGDTSMVLIPKLSNKNFRLIYKHNNAILKAVSR